MTIYIAGPMTGMPGYNLDAFNAKEAELIAEGWKVLNPAKIGLLPDYDMYWPINRAMLDGSDAIYLMAGWEDSVGARKEYYYARGKRLAMCIEHSYISTRWMDMPEVTP